MQLKQSYDNLKQDDAASAPKKRSLAGILGMPFRPGKPRQGKHVSAHHTTIDQRVGVGQRGSLPRLAQQGSPGQSQHSRLPQINVNIKKGHVASEAVSSERDDSIFQSHMLSENRRQHGRPARHGALVSGMLAAKRNLNYSEAHLDNRQDSSSLIDDSMVSMQAALEQLQIGGIRSQKSSLQSYIKKLKTIENMPAEHRKSPQLRRILEEYNKASSVTPGQGYFDKGSQGTLNYKISLSKLDSMLEAQDVGGTDQVLDPPDGGLQYLIQNNMKREYLKQKKERKKLM